MKNDSGNSSELYEKSLHVKDGLCLPEGVVAHSGFGDGSYTAEVKTGTNGEIIGAKIIFISEKEQKCWDYAVANNKLKNVGGGMTSWNCDGLDE